MLSRLAIRTLLLTLAAILSLPSLRSQDAENILQTARMNPTTHSAALRAQIRGESSTLPLTIRLKDGVVRYEFAAPEQTIFLKLSPTDTQLTEEINGTTKPISPAHRHDPIRNTGISYQDLSLGFLYWPHPVMQGEEIVKTRPSWTIDLQAPASEPLYGVARVWIDKESGAILKIEGFDKNGRLLRRFEVISGQQIDGFWTLKQMRIESFAPGNSHDVLSRNYLEILGLVDPKKI
jgi:hypothetical protein